VSFAHINELSSGVGLANRRSFQRYCKKKSAAAQFLVLGVQNMRLKYSGFGKVSWVSAILISLKAIVLSLGGSATLLF